jgi:hypothetical protein
MNAEMVRAYRVLGQVADRFEIRRSKIIVLGHGMFLRINGFIVRSNVDFGFSLWFTPLKPEPTFTFEQIDDMIQTISELIALDALTTPGGIEHARTIRGTRG